MGLTMQERNSLTREVAKRYKDATKKDKGTILDEYVKSTGLSRKHAVAKINGCIRRKEYVYNGRKIKSAKVEVPKRKKRIYKHYYDDEVLKCLIRIWNFFERMCAERLVPLIRENIEALFAEKYFSVSPEVREKLKTISPATVTRLLKSERQKNKIRGTCTTKAATSLNKLIPIRTYFYWDDRLPGFFETDTVAHDGGIASGEYCFTQTFTDVGTCWTELHAMLNKAHRWTVANAESVKQNLPYLMRGLDSDNGSEFKNYQLLKWCNENQVTFTRGRSYKKNDNCFVEQKNYSVVRHLVGYSRYEDEDARDALQSLYDKYNLLINYFYPSMKILAKERKDAHTYKRYDSAKTPYMRCMESEHIPEECKRKMSEIKKSLDLIQLKKDVDAALKKVLAHAKRWN